ncbi:MAG: branched-chain amino acid ABC transporter ATP-binding protein/permease [Candidatus Dormibacteraeota bacterium]|nr:branched-chain amino acid ABC transporter ATP-binding protein/permease [Candidatus Dormibacteraeota bacterium]
MTAAATAVVEAAATTKAERKPLLTPRRSNILLLLLGAGLLPTLTYRAMPLLPKAIPQNITVAAAIAIGALSLNLLTGYAGQISLGQGALLAVGGIVGGTITSEAGLPMWIAFPVSAIAGALTALVIGFPALRLRGLYLAVVTLSFAFAMYNAVLSLNILGGGSGGVASIRRLWGAVTLPAEYDLCAVALIVLVLVYVIDANLTRTKLGRAFRTIRENEAVAASFGVDVARFKLLAFTLSGAFAGLAGSLFAQSVYLVNSQTFASPVDYSLLLLIVVVVGGLGSRAGTVIAAFVFTLFEFLIGELFGTTSLLYGLVPMIGAALLMYTVARHPGGFASVVRERRERREAEQLKARTDSDAVPSIPRLASAVSVEKHVAAASPLIEVEGVTVRFGGLTAVDGVSLAVEAGKIVGLIGPNGAGKTTLFNAISGVLRPTAGSIRLLGADVTRLSAHERAARGLARTFQQVGLAKDQSVLDNMLLAQHIHSGYGTFEALASTPNASKHEEAMQARARSALNALGFAGRENTPVRLLSGGQQRIAEIGCALLADPAVLMLDEPSAGLAPAVVESLAERLRELRDLQSQTVLLIEHNIPLVLDVCDYVYVLNFGEVLAQGTPEEILADPDVISAYLGEAA